MVSDTLITRLSSYRERMKGSDIFRLPGEYQAPTSGRCYDTEESDLRKQVKRKRPIVPALISKNLDRGKGNLCSGVCLSSDVFDIGSNAKEQRPQVGHGRLMWILWVDMIGNGSFSRN